MSRAFTKERDADAPIELPERPVSPERNIVTRRGLELIESEMQKARDALSMAQAADDRMETAKAMRDLEYWTSRKDTAEIACPENLDKVQFGTRVTIEQENGRQKTYCIVGLDEADPSSGLLSYVSPLARNLIGKKTGEFVETGVAEFEIVKIEAC